MPDYVAFLRAINLGSYHKFPMAQLRACLDAAGFERVETYIQTGNVRLHTRLRSAARVADRLEEVFAADRGFDVPTLVLTPAELRQVYDDALAVDLPVAGEDVRRYVTLLKEPAPADAAAEIAGLAFDGEAARVVGRAVHVWVRAGYRNAKLDNARLERRLGTATTRDLKVVAALATRWGA